VTNQAEFITKQVDGINVVSVFGEVDIANVDEFRTCLEKAADDRAPGLVVDLTRTAYFDSRTIALLADFATKLRVHRQRIALVAPADGFAARILQIAGLPLIVPAFQSVIDAINSVREPAGT
jgi:anti-anti-sigma factor